MTGREFTPDEIVEGITKAIRDRELAIVPNLIALLAMQDPQRAQDILDTIELARLIARPPASPSPTI